MLDALLPITLGYLSLTTVPLLGFALAARRWRSPQTPPARRPIRIAAIVPAHREGSVLLQCVDSLLSQDYPSGWLDIVVVADHCTPELRQDLRERPITVHEVAFQESTKVRALNLAMAALPDAVEAVVIVDADNLAHPSMIRLFADRLSAGARAIQGLRLEKNRQTDLARLDGALERINHMIFRQGRAAVGLSASLAGSGMAFSRPLLEAALLRSEAVGGFDKPLEMDLICQGVRIDWCPAAIVYDEKVDDLHTLHRQRRRWISAQLIYLWRELHPALSSTLTRRSLDPLDKLVQWASLPRSLHLAALAGVGLLALATGRWGAALLSAALIAATLGAMLSALHAAGGRLDGGWRAAPGALLAMLSALLLVRGADRRFIHTEHLCAVGIDEVLKLTESCDAHRN